MKTKLLFIAIAFAFPLSSQAQIKIVSNGNVGIGTDNPLQKLHVNGPIRGDQTAGSVNFLTDYGFTKIGALNTSFSHFYTNSANFYFDKGLDTYSGKYTSYTGVNLMLCTSSNFTTRMTISQSTGNVGIGLSPDATIKLNVAGTVASNGIVLTSDINLKENVNYMDQSFNKIALLQPITFNYKKNIHKPPQIANDSINTNTAWQEVEEAFTKQIRYGFSAQDLQKVYPDLVTKDDNGYLNVDYIGLIPVLVEAMKEQQAKIAELEKKIIDLSKEKSSQ
jgi:hypothetical protein